MNEKEALEGIIGECNEKLDSFIDDVDTINHFEQLLHHATLRLKEVEGTACPVQLEVVDGEQLVDVLTGDVYMTNRYNYAEPFQGAAEEAIKMEKPKRVVIRKPGKSEPIAATPAPPAEFSSVEEICAYAASTYGLDADTVKMHAQLIQKENSDNNFTALRLIKEKVDEMGKLKRAAVPVAPTLDTTPPAPIAPASLDVTCGEEPNYGVRVQEIAAYARASGLTEEQVQKFRSLAGFDQGDATTALLNFESRVVNAVKAYEDFGVKDAEPLSDSGAEYVVDKLLGYDEQEAALVEIDMAINRLKAQKTRKLHAINSYREYYQMFLAPRMEAWIKEKVGNRVKDKFVDLNTGRVALVTEPERFVIEDKERINEYMEEYIEDPAAKELYGIKTTRLVVWENNKVVAHMKATKEVLPGYVHKPAATVVRISAGR